jgi:hypothetical protein
MAVDQIDWLKLKPYKESKHESFEQLCYQVALTLYSDQGVFTPIDDSGGGSGVEFYLEIPNGTVWGWQAKYYPGVSQRLTASRRRHIEESLRVSKRKYGDRLKRWHLCATVDFTDKGRPSELEWFQETLKGQAGGTNVEHWGDSKLLALLRHPRANGIVQFFFGEFQPNQDWFKKQVQQQLANIRDKYVPELHTGTVTDFELHALVGDHRFRAAAGKAARDLGKGIKHLTSAVSEIRALRDTEFTKELNASTAALEKLIPFLDRALQDARRFADDPMMDSSVISSVLNAAAAEMNTCWDVLRQAFASVHTAEREVGPEPDAKARRAALERLSATLRKPFTLFDGPILIGLSWFERYLEIRQGRILHLLGGAGSGKTHSLAQLSRASEGSSIFLRGVSFSQTGTIQAQILQQLDIHTSWGDFVSALDTYARVYGVQVLIAIDALNEAQDIGLWQRGLSGFEQDLKSYPGVALTTSCRRSYSKAVWGSVDTARPPFWYVSGFGEHELKEAIRRYFRYYRIAGTMTLAVLKEFEHPLYLRIFCEAENRPRKEVKQVFLGEQRLFSVLEKYLNAANTSFSERVNRSPDGGLMQSILRKFASELWKKHARHLSFDEAALLFDGKPSAEVDWDVSYTKALMDEELVLSRTYLEGGEGVEFTYDLLGGYLIADQVLATLPTGFAGFTRPEAVAVISPLLGALVDDDWRRRHPLHEDILRAFSALFPDRTARHLIYLADNPTVLTAAVNALFEMDAKYLGTGEIGAVRQLFQHPDNRPLLLHRLRDTAFSPGHPLNAQFLSALLQAMPMAERDLSWSENLREHISAVKDTVSEFRQALREPAPTEEQRRQLRLAALYSLWVLTSNDPGLRDAATEVLMMFGRRFPRLLFEMTEDSLMCNDPYVPERMLAACYGAAMAVHCRPGKDRFRDDLLPRFAQRIFRYMFAQNAPFATTHALRRDYARQTIELALHWHPDVLTPSEKKRITSPFEGGIRNWRRRPDYDENTYREGNDPLGFDWKNYTMGSLVPGRATYNYEHPGFVEVKEKILWRIHDLGYSLDRFGEIDKSIADMRWQRRNDTGVTNRYGKKYAWIAFYELYGLREDLGLFKDSWLYDGPHPGEADIDPSFPASPHKRRVLTEDVLGRRVVNVEAWVNAGPAPNFRHYLVRDHHDGERGPWLLIYGLLSGFEAGRRSGFAFLRAFFVRDYDYAKARRLLRADKVRSGWLPKVPDPKGYFAGEFPWRREFPYSNPERFDVPVGTRRVRNDDLPPILLQFSDAVIDPATQQRDEWRYEPIHDAFDVESPVQTSAFSGQTPFERPTGTVPSKQLCEYLGLWLRSPSWDMHDALGKRASITSGFGGIGNDETTVYLRQDLLESYLAEKSLTLVWIIWGERQRLTGSGSSGGYKQYKQLYSWAGGTVKDL